MAVPGWVGPAISIGSALLGGGSSGGATGKTSRKLMRKQMDEYDWQKQFRDQLLANIDAHANLFNPSSLIANLQAQDQARLNNQMGSIGRAYSSAGYRPGDTPIQGNINQAVNSSNNFRDNLMATLPQQYYLAQLQAKEGVARPDSGLINSAANINASIPPKPSFANTLASILPYLGQKAAPQSTLQPGSYGVNPKQYPAPIGPYDFGRMAGNTLKFL